MKFTNKLTQKEQKEKLFEILHSKLLYLIINEKFAYCFHFKKEVIKKVKELSVALNLECKLSLTSNPFPKSELRYYITIIERFNVLLIYLINFLNSKKEKELIKKVKELLVVLNDVPERTDESLSKLSFTNFITRADHDN